MPAASTRGRAASTGALSIGQVLARLATDFPTLTSSKLRFLEVQGIVSPTRTPSGYRKFTGSDLERLRLALTLQRDHYLPLVVIREYLDDVDAGRAPVLPAASTPPSIVPAQRRYRRDELLQASAASSQLLNEATSAGLIAASPDGYGENALAMLRALAALERHGIEPRHLRGVRQTADREVALIESALAPLLRRTDAASRGRAGEIAPELAKRLDEVRVIAVRAALDRLLGSF